jgi:hypothetical protein
MHVEKLLDRLFDLLRSERGEFGDGANDTSNAPDTDQSTGTDDVTDAPSNVDTSLSPPADATQGTQGTPTSQEETFVTGDENLDPRKLDPALQPIFKRMQAAYTKRMQSVASIQEKAQIVDRFYNDAEFARQTLAQWAQQNGYQLTQANGQAQPQQRAQAGDVPAYLVEAYKANLDPALHWMAEPQAKAMWESMQRMLAPVFQQNEQMTQKARETEWQRTADELAELAPGWEEHEDTMGELFDFMRSKELVHPTFGSKLQMLYDLATAKAASLKQAQGRVAQAGKNRVSSSRGTSSRPNIDQDIRKASTQDAWKLAVKHAMAQHQIKANGSI